MKFAIPLSMLPMDEIKPLGIAADEIAKASGNRVSKFSPFLSLSFNSVVFLGKSSSLRFLTDASKALTFTTILLILSSSF